jgi:two-component system, LytTR family, response regulator
MIDSFVVAETAEVCLRLPFHAGSRNVAVRHIIRLESQENYTRCYFYDGSSLLVARTLKVLLERLPPDVLIRLHRKHAVNPQFVAQWHRADSFVLLLTGEQISIARRRTESVRLCRRNLPD